MAARFCAAVGADELRVIEVRRLSHGQQAVITKKNGKVRYLGIPDPDSDCEIERRSSDSKFLTWRHVGHPNPFLLRNIPIIGGDGSIEIFAANPAEYALIVTKAKYFTEGPTIEY